jgi:hypothetical protein
VRQVSALVGTWVAGSLALVLIIRLVFRAVRQRARVAGSCGRPAASARALTAARFAPQRASSGHKTLAAAVAANVKERAALFAASPHEWCARNARSPWASCIGRAVASLAAPGAGASRARAAAPR